MAEAALEVVGVQNLAHGLDERVAALLEVGVVAEVGAEQPVVLAKVVDGLQGLAAHDGVDAADLVADFPRRFEEGDVAVWETYCELNSKLIELRDKAQKRREATA